MLKKIFSVLAIMTTMLIVCSTYTYARDVKYTINDIDMSITFDSSMIVFTRETEEDYKYLSYIQMSYEELMSYMDSNNIYLQAQSKDSTRSLAITKNTTDTTKTIFNLAEMSQDEINLIIEEFLSSEDYISCTQKNINNVLYLCMEFSDSTEVSEISGIQYYTVINGDEVIMTFQSDDDFSEDLRNEVYQIAKTINFNNIQQKPQIKTVSLAEKIFVTAIIILLSLAVITTVFIIVVVSPKKKHKVQYTNQAKKSKVGISPINKPNSKNTNKNLNINNKRKIQNYKNKNKNSNQSTKTLKK